MRGIHLIADTPPKTIPLATEHGTGDKQLLAESLVEELSDPELHRLIDQLVEESNWYLDKSMACSGCGREVTLLSDGRCGFCQSENSTKSAESGSDSA